MSAQRARLMVVAVASLAALASACGPQANGAPLIPTLPGDGDEHTAKPQQPGTSDPGKTKDQWSGRTDLIQPPATVAPSAVELPPVSRFTLKNGLQVIVLESRGLPVVEMELAVKVGRVDAPRDKMGVAELAAAMLTKGTRTRNAQEIVRMVDFAGGTLSGNASYEASLVRCSVLAKDIGTCLKLLPSAVIEPTFPEEELQSVADQLKMGVLQRREEPSRLAAAHFQNLLWGDEHARGWTISLQTVGTLGRKDLIAWHRSWYRPNNAVLAIAGDVDPKKLRRDLEKAFRRWRKAKIPKRRAFKEPALRGIKVRLVDQPGSPQAQIRVGHLGIAHRHQDFFEILVLDHILGGGSSSRLMQRLGAKDGAGATASSSFDRNLDRGAFIARTFARTKETVANLRLVVQEIQRMAASGPSKVEVDRAIADISGRYASGFESTTTLANSLLAAELHGLDEGYVSEFSLRVAKVSPDSARVAAAKHFDAGNLAVVVVGDAKAIAPQLTALGLDFDKVGYREPVANYERAPEPEDPKAADAEGRRILDAALKAKGGEAKLAGLKSMLLVGLAKATVKQPDGATQSLKALVRRLYVAPNRMRRDTELDGGKAITVIVLDGNEAWASQVQGGKSQAAELPPAFVGALREELWRDQELILLRHKEKGTLVAALPDKEIDKVGHHTVRVTRVDGKVAVTLYIDKKTHLVRRMTYSAEGNLATEDYRNYKAVSGIKVAHRRRVADAASSFDVTMEKVEFNLQYDPKVFAKPSK